ncbi:hypothetical protein N7450_010279 [Penicillium hetheringtonii]|uniref:Uncharacterized protein n=1 Tax=Penicillium hetheringtonii TaxID=911720 RepID=A0AAD6DCH4_9EURO|nr:hypothetical protein N7450_010279 [Penicillium hetheringtonii]
MIQATTKNPVSVKSLAGSPVLKPEDCADNFEEELRSISNELPPKDIDIDHPPFLESPDHETSSIPKVITSVEVLPSSSEKDQSSKIRHSVGSFFSLPFDIHEQILEHYFGPRVRVNIPSATPDSSPRSWSKCPRFTRRRQMTDLALVCRSWRQLIQARIYRHIELKGTHAVMLECREWFLANPSLVGYVRIVEIWIPVWGKRAYTPVPRVLDRRRNHHQLFMSRAMGWEEEEHPMYDIPFLTSDENSTMEEIFQHMQLFSSARILILEGGHANSPPDVQHFRTARAGDECTRTFPQLPHIETLVMRGAWNLVRTYRHWTNMSRALPALREWHSIYPTPRIDVELLVSRMLHHPPKNLCHLYLNIEGTGITDDPSPSPSPYPDAVCTLLGHICTRLETVSFTGKVCELFFNTLYRICKKACWPPRLRSLDVSVISCCPDTSDPDAPVQPQRGVTNLTFIHGFEKIVIATVRCLEFLPTLAYVNLRYLDASPICPLIKPYFNLTNNECKGVWSPEIIEALRKSRPQAKYIELTDGISPEYGDTGRFLGIARISRRPISINTRMYDFIAH